MNRKKKIADLIIMGAKTPIIVRLVDDINQERRSLRIVGFFDNNPLLAGKEFMGYPVFGAPKALRSKWFKNCRVINNVCVSTLDRKETTLQLMALGMGFTNIIHPSVNLQYVKLGVGNLIHAGAILQPTSEIGNHCAIAPNVNIGNGAKVGDYCFIGPSSVIGGYSHIGEMTFIGMMSGVVPKTSIGKGALIGAGSIVTRDVAQFTTVWGQPAKRIRSLSAGTKTYDATLREPL